MILRKPIFKTRRFLKKTLENLKSLFSKEYQILPKKKIKKEPINNPPLKQQKELLFHPNFTSLCHGNSSKNSHRHEQNEANTSSSGNDIKEERKWVVVEKLKELEKMSDVDNILDIEEFLHYYSRLKCTAYLEIVDRFFMQICSEFLVPSAHSSINARSKQITLIS